MTGRDEGRGGVPDRPGRDVRGKRLFEFAVPEDVRRELASHLEMKVEELVAAGWTPAAARVEAERLFGDSQSIAAECRTITQRQRRTARLVAVAGTVLHDLRHGLRVLMRHRSFTVVALLTLGLGIGANVAVFAIIDGLLLAPLPYARADRLVAVSELNDRGGRMQVAEPNYLDWAELSTSFTGMSAYRGPFSSSILVGETAVRRPVTVVTGEFFEVMGGRAVVGRLPRSSEMVADVAGVAVVSHSFWQSALGGVTDLSGALLDTGGYQFPVAAVLEASFDFPLNTDVWIATYYPSAGGTRTSHNYQVVARLDDGVSLESARAEMRALGGQLAVEHAGAIDAVSVDVMGLSENLYGSYRAPLLLLLGASAIVLLVSCTNLASAMLARSLARGREVAVRVSLGAGRTRIARQLLTENLLLALAGGAAGLFIAFGVLAAVRAVAPSSILQLRETSLSGPVLLFTLAVSVAAVLLFGLVPALRLKDRNAASLLRGGDRGATGRRGPVWGALVAAEVGMALILLVFTGLLVRSFREVIGVDAGFEPDNILTVDLYVPQSTYPDDASLVTLHSELLPALAQVPGVRATGVVSLLPMTGSLNGGVNIEGDEALAYAEYRVADAAYFDVMSIPLVRGRTFNVTDRSGAPEVALVDEAFVRAFMPNVDPVGRRIRNLRNDAWVYGTENWITIVGVVGAVRQRSLLQDPDPTIYVPAGQRPFRARDAVVTLRVEGADPGVVTAGVRGVITRVAPSVPFEIGTARSQIGGQLADRRFAMFVTGGFGLIALVLAAIGIHAVVAYSVERRSREMGVRIALGAVPDGVARRVVLDAMRPVAVGLAAGLFASFGLSRFIESALVSVEPSDPLTVAVSVSMLTTVALIASALPARRVAYLDPIASLRAD